MHNTEPCMWVCIYPLHANIRGYVVDTFIPTYMCWLHANIHHVCGYVVDTFIPTYMYIPTYMHICRQQNSVRHGCTRRIR
jgi:hypothetical protein